MQSDGGKAGDEHDLHRRVDFGGAFGQLDAVHAGHNDVGEQQIEAEARQAFIGVFAVAEIGDLVAGADQGLRQELAQGFVVFDQ